MNKHIQNSQFEKLYTADQTRRLDNRTIKEFGIDGFTLMELAASGAAYKISEIHGKESAGLYLCGKGNNAGDALAVARYLTNHSCHKIYLNLLFGDDSLSDDTRKNLQLLMKCKEGGADIILLNSDEKTVPKEIDYIVDGLFGTGLKGDLKPPVSEWVTKANSSKIPVYSMDLPTGLNPDSGKTHGTAIRATTTFTFGTNKIGFYLNQADQYTGRVEQVPLPFPNHLFEEETARLINGQFPHTPPLIQRSAWKQGAGAVFLYSPQSLLPVYDLNLATIIKIPLGVDADHYFKESHADKILKNMKEKPGTLLIGPGIGKHEETGKLVRRLLNEHEGYSVIDADGLSFFDDFSTLKKANRERWILTPHIGEAKSYLGGDFSKDSERLNWAKTFTDKVGSTLLLKGDPLFVSRPGSPPYITGYKTDMFNRAGFGDVLAGSIATRLSISNDLETAVISALLHGYHTFKNLATKQPFSPEDLL
tara:strand:+ start:8808 stop:10241 length:1434 start_codon:yes stop_codon:yes gene_type:complete